MFEDQEFGVVPPIKQLPVFNIPLSQFEREKLQQMWETTSSLHRHEDTLLNNRLQGFLVTTAFLLAAFSQFRESQYWKLQCVVGLFGFCFAIMMMYVLFHTAEVIEWYRIVLVRLDGLLFDENLQPYRARRLIQGSINQYTGIPVKRPVTAYLSIDIPALVCLLWVVLTTLAFLKH